MNKIKQCQKDNNKNSKGDPMKKDAKNTSKKAIKKKSTGVKLIDELTKKLDTHKGVSIGHLNTRSILPKIDEIKMILTNSNLDILTISESWLDNSILPHEIEIAGYTTLRKDRNRHGGGVMQYIKNDLNFKERSDLEHENIEATWIEVPNITKNEKYLICSYYRSPEKQIDYFNDTIDMINKATNEGKGMIICGDFNWDYKLDETLATHKVKQLEDLFTMQQIVHKPTRTESGNKILDLILTTNPDNHIYTDVLPLGLSDHYMPYTVIKTNKTPQPHNYAIIRCYKNFQEDAFLYDLERQVTIRNNETATKYPPTTNKIQKDMEIELNYKWKHWKEDFLKVSNKHAPLRTVRMRQGGRNWITPDIAKTINRRDQTKARASSTKDPIAWEEYRYLRKQVKKMIDKEKKEHYKGLVQTKQSNTKFWKEMTKLIPKKINMASIPKNLTLDELNKYFSEVGSKNIAEVAHKKKTTGVPWKGPECIYNFEIQTVREHEVIKCLENLKTTTNSDILGIDCKLLKLASALISKDLTELINLSIKSDSVPADWKIARVTPVYKGNGSKEDPTNYRPISVVCHIAKSFEKIIAIQFITYLTKNNLITSDQSAYLHGRSTQTSLHRVIDDILESMDNGEITAACFIDISKCFDSIDHKFLLTKLEKHGIRKNIGWFKSYLSGRQQAVINNGTLSDKRLVKAGVPQGSVLGPFLFILFANDISNFINNGQINCYADDALIYVSGNNLKEAEKQLQQCIDAVEYWYTENKLKVNARKTEVMIFGTPQKIAKINVENFCIKFGAIKLKVVKEFKYLGIHLDQGLTWNKHCSNILSNAGLKLHLMRRLNKILPKKIMIQVYKTYMMPILEYAATVWGYTSTENINLLQKIIHLSARIICNNYDFINSRGADLVKELGWNNFEDRRDFLLAVLMYKCHEGSAPDYLLDKLDLHSEINIRQSRHTDETTYNIPRTRLNKTEAAYFVQGPRIWNKLPSRIREAETLEQFKQLYKKEILGLKVHNNNNVSSQLS